MASPKSLSTWVITPSDLKRLKRELETLDDFMRQAGLRRGEKAGVATKLPKTSQALDELASASKANLLHTAERQELLAEVAGLIDRAPLLHISFASEPSAAFLTKLVVWLRANIHPQVLVQVGLQPSIAAGCIVRTPNKSFDFSLAQAFEKQRLELVRSLKTSVPSEVKS